MKKTAILLILFTLLVAASPLQATQRTRYNFNPDWLLFVGDDSLASGVKYDDKAWKTVCLPSAFNEDEAFAVPIQRHTGRVVWYRKHFKVPAKHKGQKIFIEFEGARQAAEVWVNGQRVGLHEDGVMAFGYDLTDLVVTGGKDNVIAVRIDNSWDYRERDTGTPWQWNDRNFNANYGGLTKNVILHCTDRLYQTLPLYNNLGTTGVYVYADDIDIRDKTATLHVESEVRNEYDKPRTFYLNVVVRDNDNNMVREFHSGEVTLQPGETTTLTASAPLRGLRFWSWGYGYLYHISTSIVAGKTAEDIVVTTTGFRKTEFRNGMFYLNDRALQLKGYAQRTSNEWPGVGMSVAPWLSDYSNGLMERGNANLVRWMHVTPWKQDIESCDRVGLIQAMPAGDSEKDVEGRQWEQRLELMRDAIVYNRNNPSIIFYECGNKGISEQHMTEMKALRDYYDPHGGRAIGAREMLDSQVAEYGGEMLYINKSAGKPVFAHEYNRNEGVRKYWDDYSHPFHKDGQGPLYRGQDASDYNMNMDSYVVETVRRWYDYWECRPGTGRRVSSGAVNIVFSDTNTHFRGAENFRRSGEVDAMRIPKDAYYAHEIMWGGWVNTESKYYKTHIVGHWNYAPGTVKDVYVVSNAERVELFVNGISQGFGERSYQFLFRFKDIKFSPGRIRAVGYDARGKEIGEESVVRTTAEPQAVRLSLHQGPGGFKADGSDMVLVTAEVIDKDGQRCPLADNQLHFQLDGPAEWRGGIAIGRDDNYVLSKDLPVEAGVNRVLLRATRQAGKVTLIATADGLRPDTVSFNAKAVDIKNGLTTWFPKDELTPWLWRGATPNTPSFTIARVPVSIRRATAGSHPEEAARSFDDNENTEWRNDGTQAMAWIEYQLSRRAPLSEMCLKLTGWRHSSYHLRVTGYYTDEEQKEQSVVLWQGRTPLSLGYVTLPLGATESIDRVRIETVGDQDEHTASVVALEDYAEPDRIRAPKGNAPDGQLRIVEVEFYTQTLGSGR